MITYREITCHLLKVQCDDDRCSITELIETKNKSETVERLRAVGWYINEKIPTVLCPKHNKIK